MPVNVTDHSLENVQKLDRTGYDLSVSNNFSGKIGQLLPCYIREATIGDSFELTPNISIRFAPTVQPLQTRMKAVIDYFFVPLQAVWKNAPLFFNAMQNQVKVKPEQPYMKIPDYAGFFKTGSLSDYLGVSTTVAGEAVLPYNQAFNISFDGSFDYSRLSVCDTAPGQQLWQYCFLGAYERRRCMNDSMWSDEGVGSLYIKHLLSYYCPDGFSSAQLPDTDYKYWDGSKRAKNLDMLSVNDAAGLHTYDVATLYGQVKGSFFVGAVTHVNNYNKVSLSNYLSGRFHIDKGLLGNYNPNEDTSGLYMVLFAGLKSSSGSDFFLLPRKEMIAYALPENLNVTTYTNNSNGDRTCSHDVVMDSATLGLWNSAIDKYMRIYGVDDPHFLDLSIGFFTYYPVDVYDDDQGYFSLPFSPSICEQRWNNAHPLTTEFLQGSAFDNTGFYDPDAPMPGNNIHLDSAVVNLAYESHRLSAKGFYETVNCFGLSVSTMLSFIDIHEGEEYVNGLFSSVNDADPRLPLKAYRWRVYECIYNFWYRNKDLNPLLDGNGNRVINQYLRDDQMADGADVNQYPMRYALLEKDQFTSCLTQPLVNYAPLVGIREKDDRNVILDFAAREGVSSVAIGVEQDTAGNDYMKMSAYGSDIPEDTMSVLRDCINQGISIHDLHSVESLTRWISNHVEHGYNMSDQQLASFGINTDWNPLTSPIYLGGTSELINNGTVVDQSGEGLGMMAGMLTARSNFENVIKYFCHERGFVMGIMRVVPIPLYPSAMAADFFYGDFYDFYTPEFDRKGWEPVYYRELCPLMASLSAPGSGTTENDVFGYNVPWHQYKFSYDEMHGDLRKSFSSMVLYREFGEVPVLGNSFTECHPEDYNNIFNQRSILDDKFTCQVYTQANWMRPISNPQTRVF